MNQGTAIAPVKNGNGIGREFLHISLTSMSLAGAIGALFWLFNTNATANNAMTAAQKNEAAIERKADKEVVDQIHIDIREIRNKLDLMTADKNQPVYPPSTKYFRNQSFKRKEHSKPCCTSGLSLTHSALSVDGLSSSTVPR